MRRSGRENASRMCRQLRPGIPGGGQLFLTSRAVIKLIDFFDDNPRTVAIAPRAGGSVVTYTRGEGGRIVDLETIYIYIYLRVISYKEISIV